MKLIERYVCGSLLTAFALAWLVLTFVLSVGLLVKVTSLIARGLPAAVAVRYFLIGIPATMGFTIPLALLIAALLVFGRLSADSEIAAMRACGINVARIMAWPLFFGLLMSALCLYINNEVTPRSEEARSHLAADAKADLWLDIMDPGRFNPGPRNMSIWFARRNGDYIEDVLIFDKTRTGANREIRARRARFEQRGNDLLLEFQDVWIDPFSEDRPGAASADRLVHTVVDAFKPGNRPKRISNYSFRELVRQLREDSNLADPALAARLRRTCPDCARGACQDPYHLRVRASGSRAAELRFELHKRLALASGAFCFVLIGMPLGIRAHRRESTIGVAIGLGVALIFYLAVILADALKKDPRLYPHLIVWIPVAACLVVAAILLPRHQ